MSAIQSSEGFGASSRRFDWPGEKDGADWRLGKDVTLAEGSPSGIARYLRCGSLETDVATHAILKGIKVKPDTGYIARCRVKADGGGAQLTFAVMKTSGGSSEDTHSNKSAEDTPLTFSMEGLEFYASRDEYLGGASLEWEEIELPFRTEAGQEEVALYAGRRYGPVPILYDAVELIEDDSVVAGEIVPVSRPLPSIEAGERARGYLVSRQPWMQPAFASYRPARDEITDEVRCWLSPGQYEPATFALTGVRDLSNVFVKLAGDLKSPRGDTLDANSVDVGLVRTITRWLTNSAPLVPGQRYERRPIYIFPNKETNLDAGETKTWWLTVHVPEGQAPGTYHGQILISAKGVEDSALDFSVEVLPIKLVDPEVTYGMFYRHFEQVNEFKTEEMFLRAAKDMAAHGMNSITIYSHLERPKSPGVWETDLDYDSGRSYSLNRQMRLLEKSGLLTPDHPLLLLPSHGGNDTIFDYKNTLSTLIEKQKEAGWPEFLIFMFDEVADKYDQWEALDQEIGKISELRQNRPDLAIRLASTAPGEKSGYFDVIIRGEKIPGKEMWTYNCTWNGSLPLNDRYFAGFYTWSEGLLGNWQWCYTEGRRLKLSDSGEIDLGETRAYVDPLYTNYVLPDEEVNIPTIGWEGRRAGVDDYRYLQTLRETIKVADESNDSQKQILAKKAQAFLDGIKEKVAVPDAVKPRSELNSVKAYHYIMNPDLPAGEYETIRRETAEWIMRLSQ